MARLIIGHTTDHSTRIWVRGDTRYPCAFVTLTGPAGNQTQVITLEQRHGYTGVVDFAGLTPSTQYQVQTTFGKVADAPPARQIDFGHCQGQLMTFPAAGGNDSLRFLLGSCNLHSLGFLSDPDPAFETLLDIAISDQVHFMIHCGDQIYYDIPNPLKGPDIQEYRDKYLDAWGDSRPTRKFLTQLPQYMVLDDHEITNDFTNTFQSGSSLLAWREASLKVYREFQYIHSPRSFGNQALYYNFDYGAARFFVLDTRTERYTTNQAGTSPQMISLGQMERFLDWLQQYPDEVKFVVSSVPFVAEVRHHEDDKWCSDPFREQREKILACILDKGIRRLVFLTGDMHSSYHATLELKAIQGNKTATIHELMSSPINQLDKAEFTRYKARSAKMDKGRRFNYTSTLAGDEFYSDHSNAMLIDLQGKTLRYEIFRTKKIARQERTGTIEL